MRRMLFVLPALVVAACSGPTAPADENASGNAPGPQSTGAMTVDPQKIVSAAGNLRTMHGEFTIRAARPNEPSVDPATIGGACLLAKIPVEGKSCNAAQDCNIAIAGQPTPWTGYCLGPDNLPTTQNGTCWVKPSDRQYCLKGVGPGDHATPVTDTSPVYDYVAQTSPQWRRPIDWVLVGCLNGAYTGKPPCAGGSGPSINRASQVRPVP